MRQVWAREAVMMWHCQRSALSANFAAAKCNERAMLRAHNAYIARRLCIEWHSLDVDFGREGILAQPRLDEVQR